MGLVGTETSLHVIESFVLDLVGCAGRWRVVCASVWLVVQVALAGLAPGLVYPRLLVLLAFHSMSSRMEAHRTGLWMDSTGF